MFILNNINGRKYRSIYPDLKNVIFDMSDKQLSNAKNKDWSSISKGSIVCVIGSSRRISTFCVADEIIETDNIDPEEGASHVLIGRVIAKTMIDEDMSVLLKRFGVSHPHLRGNKFSIGFNVAYLEESFDDLPVKVKNGESTLKEVIESQAGQS
jgi:hypothetical protein